MGSKIDFGYHKSRPEDVPAFEAVREAYQKALDAVVDNVPDGRQSAIALTHLETSLLFAIRAITQANRD